MKSVYKSLQRVDIADAVDYFGVTELLDYIGSASILKYLDSLPEAVTDVDPDVTKLAIEVGERSEVD